MWEVSSTQTDAPLRAIDFATRNEYEWANRVDDLRTAKRTLSIFA